MLCALGVVVVKRARDSSGVCAVSLPSVAPIDSLPLALVVDLFVEKTNRLKYVEGHEGVCEVVEVHVIRHVSC